MSATHRLGLPNARIRLLTRWNNFRLGLRSVSILLSHLLEPIQEVEIRDQKLDLVNPLSMMRIMARRTKRTYKKISFTEGLHHLNRKKVSVTSSRL